MPHSKPTSRLSRFAHPRHRDRGAALVEMGMTVGLISVLAIGAVLATGKTAKQAFCLAGDALASSQGKDYGLTCEDGASQADTGLVIPDGAGPAEGVVSNDADFSDKLFAKGEIGGQIVMVGLADAAPEPFQLITRIASQNGNDLDRTISACFGLETIEAPICAPPSSESEIIVSAGATSIGYRVELPEDVARLWENTVEVDVSPAAGIDPSFWQISVDRAEPDTVFTPSFDFPDLELAEDVSGWIEQFTDVQGSRNRQANLRINTSQYIDKYACYRDTPESDPVCGAIGTSNNRSTVNVPADAAQIGYMLELPAPMASQPSIYDVTADLVLTTALQAQDLAMVTRLNSEPVFYAAFDMPDHTFEADDTSTQYAFFDIPAERNIDFRLTGSPEGVFTRYVCWKMDASTPDTEATCVRGSTNSPSSITIPKEASQMGVRLDLPAARVDSKDDVYVINYQVVGEDDTGARITDVLYDSQTLTRPNTRPIFEVSYDTPDVMLTEEDSGAFEMFFDISGERNSDMLFSATPADGTNFNGYICWRMTSDPASEGDCEYRVSDKKGSILVPQEAEQIGIRFTLNAPRTDTVDDVYAYDFALAGANNTYSTITDPVTSHQTVTRPSTDPVFDVSVAMPDVMLSSDDTGAYEAWYDLAGDWNSDLLLTGTPADGASFTGYICWRMTSDPASESDCQYRSSDNRGSILVPEAAQQIGFRFTLNAPKFSNSDDVYPYEFTLAGATSTTRTLTDPISFSHTVTRPNTPIVMTEDLGLVPEGETRGTAAATAAAGEKAIYWLDLGDHNTDVSFSVKPYSDVYHHACWKPEADSPEADWTCKSQRFDNYQAVITIPAGVRYVGFGFNAPSTGSKTETLTLRHKAVSSTGSGLTSEIITRVDFTATTPE